MNEQSRNAAWTKTALAHKNSQGQPIAKEEVTFKSVALKDENGQVIIPANLDDGTQPKLLKSKPVLERTTIKSAFADAPVVNAFSGF